MEIEKIYFIEEIKDVNNDNIEVFVENEDGYTYVISAATPQYFLEEMNQKKTNFLRPGPPVIIVKKIDKRNCYGSGTILCGG